MSFDIKLHMILNDENDIKTRSEVNLETCKKCKAFCNKFQMCALILSLLLPFTADFKMSKIKDPEALLIGKFEDPKIFLNNCCVRKYGNQKIFWPYSSHILLQVI